MARGGADSRNPSGGAFAGGETIYRQESGNAFLPSRTRPKVSQHGSPRPRPHYYNSGRKRLAGTDSGKSSWVYNRTYVLTEWDPGKAGLNKRKHGISFADAVVCLEDEGALTMRDRFSDEEERWITMGLDGLGRVLVVIYTWRGESVHLISARKATTRERRRYEDANETRI